jgi:hypothetical protein
MIFFIGLDYSLNQFDQQDHKFFMETYMWSEEICVGCFLGNHISPKKIHDFVLDKSGVYTVFCLLI